MNTTVQSVNAYACRRIFNCFSVILFFNVTIFNNEQEIPDPDFTMRFIFEGNTVVFCSSITLEMILCQLNDFCLLR